MNLFKNYIKIYFRRFRKDTVHFLVNILGLGLGFSILFFILMFVYDEQNIDQFHSKKNQVFRVIVDEKGEDGTHEYVSTPGPLADALVDYFPGVVSAAHMSCTGSQVIQVGDVMISDREWAFVTKNIFDILDIKILDGNPKKPFQGEAGLVITPDAAKRLFGHTDVVGETVDRSRFGDNLEVLAIMEQLPRNSTYQFSELYVVNYDRWSEGWKRYSESWEGNFTMTWVLLDEHASPKDIYSDKDAFLSQYYSDEELQSRDFHLQSLTDIHLESMKIEQGGMAVRPFIPSSSSQFVSIILLLGFLVLFIASLNYINLSSVQALKRTLEASMRKINGARNKDLLQQLFFETLITILIAYALAICLVILCFPVFLSIANKDFTQSLLFSEDFIIYHIAAILIIWMFSALVPAIYYSRLERSVLILKNAFSGKGDFLRKVLVGVQYGLSIFLIIGSIIIYRQLNYVQSKDLGFDRKKLITLDINSREARSNFKNVLQEIKKNANVTNATVSSRVPGEWKNIPSVRVGKNLTDEMNTFSHYGIEKGWLETFDIKLYEGKNFSGIDATDSLHILVNQKAVSALSLNNPIGSSVWLGSNDDTAF
ncbi:MAG: ABC transporter permease [Bacteroidota bacterium]